MASGGGEVDGIYITVSSFGNLRQFLPQGAETADLELPAGSTVEALVHRLAIPESEFWFAAVNGQKVDDNYLLQAGDQVALFSPVGGG